MTPFARARPESCLSDLVLDRLRLGELEGTPEQDRVRAHLAGCRDCSARMSELHAEADIFSKQIWVTGESRRVQKKLRWWLPAIGVAAALLVVVALPLRNAERIKGSTTLNLVVRHTDGMVEPVLPGQVLKPGEAIRFSVTSASRGALFIVGLDAAQLVSIYEPQGTTPRMFGPARDQWVEGSIILDSTLGPERVVALICPGNLSVSEVHTAATRALKAAGGDPERVGSLGLGCDESTFLFRKRAE